MKRVLVTYLKVDGNYTDGQSLVDKPDAMMTTEKAEYYLEDAERRGLNFNTEIDYLDVSDEEAEDYQSAGYTVVNLPTDSPKMTFQQIQAQLREIEINLKSHEGDEAYDLSELQQEKEELEDAIANGDYADFNDFE